MRPRTVSSCPSDRRVTLGDPDDAGIDASTGAGGLLVTVTQVSYVLGVFLLVSVDAEARGRIITAFVTSGLTGGAGGSALASVLWSAAVGVPRWPVAR